MRPTARALIVRLLIPACLLPSLTACGRSGSGRTRLPPALSSALEGGAINAGGETPLWALQIRPKAVTFSSEQVASITLPSVGPASAPNAGMWTGTAGGRTFQALITASPCRDMATGLSYPLSARVQAMGVTYQGCAARAGQGLGPRS